MHLQAHKRSIVYCIVLSIVFATSVFAQGGMQLRRYITDLDSAKTLDELKKSEKNFVKLITEGKKVRESYYYAALSNILIAFKSEPNDIDEYCVKADAFLKKLDSISPNNSEIMVLFAMNSAAKITADPVKRSAKFGASANKYSERAIMLNGNNPRAHLIKARTVMSAPPKLGGGPKFAVKHYEKAIEKFKEFEPLAETEPNWGEAMAKRELKDCKSKLSAK